MGENEIGLLRSGNEFALERREGEGVRGEIIGRRGGER